MALPGGGNSFGIIPTCCMVGLASMLRQSLIFFFKILPFGAPLNAYRTDVWFVL